MNELLNKTMQETVVEAISDVDIKSIIRTEIEKTTRRVVDDLFGNYGDFKKELETHIKEQMSFNIKKLTIPDFGNFAIETVSAEIKKIEHEEKDRIAKETEKRLRELLGANKEAITLKELENVFAVSMFEEHYKDTLDVCYAEHQNEPETLEDVLDIMQDDNPFEFILNEREWGSYGRYCMTHIYMKYEHDGNSHAVEVHVSRKKDVSSNEYDFYKEDEKNMYSILGVSINGNSIKKEGFVALDMINEPTEEKLVNRFINGSFIDATNLSNFELEIE